MSNPTELPDVKQILQTIRGNYFLQEEGKPLPVCEGCFNVGESCGTPCVSCERIEAWEQKWMWHLMVKGQYVVWKRRLKGK